MRATILFVALCAVAVLAVTAQSSNSTGVVTVPPAVNVTGGGITQPVPTPSNPVGLPAPANGTIPANITTWKWRNASRTLKVPIIYSGPNVFDPTLARTGKIPKRWRRARVLKNIFGGDVEYVHGRTKHGCRCRKKLKNRHRYDVELRDRKSPRRRRRCRCGKKRKAKIPPVIAALYPSHHRRGRKGRKGRSRRRKGRKGKKKRNGAKKKKRQMVKPEYRPSPKKFKKSKPCKKDRKRKRHVQPEFYPREKPFKHKGVIVNRKLRAARKRAERKRRREERRRRRREARRRRQEGN